MIIPIFIIGLISSIVTEIFKLFPGLNQASKEAKRLLAFIVTVILSFVYLISEGQLEASQESLVFFVGALGASFVVYKSVIQTIEGTLRIKKVKQVETQ